MEKIWLLTLKRYYEDWMNSSTYATYTYLSRAVCLSLLLFYHLKFSQILLSHLIFFFCFLGPHPRHMEVPRLGVESELQLPAYTTATATPDPSSICDLCLSLQSHWILNSLSEARNWTCIVIDSSQVCYQLSHNSNSKNGLLNLRFLSMDFHTVVSFFFFPAF